MQIAIFADVGPLAAGQRAAGACEAPPGDGKHRNRLRGCGSSRLPPALDAALHLRLAAAALAATAARMTNVASMAARMRAQHTMLCRSNMHSRSRAQALFAVIVFGDAVYLVQALYVLEDLRVLQVAVRQQSPAGPLAW